jgi:4-amino-4-deoxy-L-arabinose transferase-like glycosyltransferase
MRWRNILDTEDSDAQWLRVGYVWIGILLLVRWAYIASGTTQLGEDEAYQWLWSKHLALSYYSKPPMIAYVQYLSTTIWGDTTFGVRFFSPVISAVLGFLVLRFFAREANARAGCLLLLIATATPLMSVGAVMMTVDPLSVLFWTLAMLTGWRAAQEDSGTKPWLWTGLWMGLGFLSKYTALFQWLCWAVFFVMWAPARKHLRKPGPYLALLVNLVCALPVLVWNYQNQWVTVAHVADDAGVNVRWRPTLKYLGEFLGSEAGLMTPVFFVGMVWAGLAWWRRGRRNPLQVYLFSMGAPLFLVYLVHSFHSRVLPNWIVPSVLPLFGLMVLYWDGRWRSGVTAIKHWLAAGLALGFCMVILGHQPDLIPALTGYRLPVNLDILHRVRMWSEVARVVGEVRQELLAEGKPVFIIADHYGIAGEVSFYLPEARASVEGQPLVYFRSSSIPRNQFYFWPGYHGHKGENAIFFHQLERENTNPIALPSPIGQEFESVTDLGVRNVLYHGRLLRPLQFWACRGLKE